MAFSNNRSSAPLAGENGAKAVNRVCRSTVHSDRSARRQELSARLQASGPRPVFEAFLELEAGRGLDDVLEEFARIPASVYRAIGASELLIHQPLHVIRGGRQ
jgi:hypothetical protein